MECFLNDIFDFHNQKPDVVRFQVVFFWLFQSFCVVDYLSIISSGINVDLDTNIVLLQMVSNNALTDQTTDLYIVTY